MLIRMSATFQAKLTNKTNERMMQLLRARKIQTGDEVSIGW
jgi:hypothetical protein